jgi:hypothetical protein
MLTNEGRKLIAASNLVAASVSRLVAARVILANLLPLLSRATRMPFDCVTMLPILLPLLSVSISSAIAS